MGKLTDVALRNWVRAGKPVAVADGDGLTFTLSAKGTAAWVLRYRLDGMRKEITLGRYPDVTLTKAREIASEKRVAVFQGVDVAQEKKRRREAAELASVSTVRALYDEFFARQIEGHRKSPQQVSGVFELHILPVIGSQVVSEVKPADIDRVLRPLTERGIFRTAAKALQLTKRLFDFAMKRHLIAANPASPFNWTDIGGKVGPRSRVLTVGEITEFFRGIQTTPNFPQYSAAALKLLLALGVRKMELLKSTWDEFDLEGGEWHLPKERTKTDAAIRIPLSPWVIEILKEQKKRGYNDYVFPVLRLAPGKVTKYMGETTLNHALYMLQANLEPFTVHDLRRTARTHLAALGVPPHIAEMCLNHKPKGIEAVYNIHDYFSERKEALQLLSDLLERCESQAEKEAAS